MNTLPSTRRQPHPAQLRTQRGLTLVELLIASLLGLIVVGALVGVFVVGNQGYKQNEAIAQLQDNARFALDTLSRDLAMAGYWGGVRAADALTNVRVSSANAGSVANDCRPSTAISDQLWLFRVETPIAFHNHATGLAPLPFGCLNGDHLVADSDLLLIRRVSGVDARLPGEAGVVANRYFVKTNQNIGSLFRAGTTFDVAGPTDCPDGSGANAPCPPVDLPVQVYAYTPQLYYVRNWLRTVGDGLPVLCRRYLDDTAATAEMREDCFAEGVENLQIEWGIGSSGVQQYSNAPTANDLRDARTARLHLIVRSVAPNVRASGDAKTFTLADYTSPALSGQLRRSYSTTVQLKNFQL